MNRYAMFAMLVFSGCTTAGYGHAWVSQPVLAPTYNPTGNRAVSPCGISATGGGWLYAEGVGNPGQLAMQYASAGANQMNVAARYIGVCNMTDAAREVFLHPHGTNPAWTAKSGAGSTSKTNAAALKFYLETASRLRAQQSVQATGSAVSVKVVESPTTTIPTPTPTTTMTDRELLPKIVAAHDYDEAIAALAASKHANLVAPLLDAKSRAKTDPRIKFEDDKRVLINLVAPSAQ